MEEKLLKKQAGFDCDLSVPPKCFQNKDHCSLVSPGHNNKNPALSFPHKNKKLDKRIAIDAKSEIYTGYSISSKYSRECLLISLQI